jgi:hypothetical protein
MSRRLVTLLAGAVLRPRPEQLTQFVIKYVGGFR